MQLTPILDCAFGIWSPGIGDATPVGWVTVGAYALAAFLSLRVAATPTLPPQPAAERLFWLLAGAALAFLAVNKQLDLQSLMTALGRCTARLQGWYDARRPVQVAVILAFAAAALILGVATLVLLRRRLVRTLPAILGLVMISAFVTARAVGFHHMDRLIGTSVAGVRLNWIFELSGITVFCLGALWAAARDSAR